MGERWDLDWPRGRLSLHATGGMLGDLSFILDNGREVAPLHQAPWLGEDIKTGDPMLHNLRGEFVCLPYGAPYGGDPVAADWRQAAATPIDARDGALTPEDALLHGHCAVADWQLVDRSSNHVSISVDYPDAHPIRRLTRTVSIAPEVGAVEFELAVEARRPCRRPLGLHPSFALPCTVGAFEIRPDGYAFGLVHPCGPEPGISSASAGAGFERLDAVPLADGTTGAFDRLPLAKACEEVLMLAGTKGGVTLVDRSHDVAYRLEWDANLLPSLILWISNRGRTYAPWNGRNLCVGVEPVAAAFLGAASGLADNPIRARGVATSIAFSPERETRIKYRLEALPATI